MIRFAVTLLVCILALGNANAQELMVLESDNLKCNDSVLVFTPKNLNENTLPSSCFTAGADATQTGARNTTSRR